MKFDIKAGIPVKYTINGVEGVITSRIQRINGCMQYIITQKDPKETSQIWADAEDLEPMVPDYKETEETNFLFDTGEKLHNLITGKKGIVTLRKQDKNGCIGYWIENGEQNPENGSMLEFYGFEQEFEKVDEGINKKVEKKNTGCFMQSSSGKY